MQTANYFEKNLKIIDQQYPVLATQIKAISDGVAFKLDQDQHGEPELFCCFADGSSKAYHAGIAPSVYATDLVKRLKLSNPRILVFFGFALGLQVLEYLKNPDPINHVILIIEPHPQAFKLALQNQDLSALFNRKNVYVALGTELPALKKVFEEIFFTGPWLRYANAIEYIPHVNTVKLMPDFFKQVQEELQKSIAAQYNRFYSDAFDCYRGLENVIHNLANLSKLPSLQMAQNLFKGKAGVVVASGPSLSTSLKYLKSIQDHAVIVACPSALPALLAAGIKAHIWVNIERIIEQTQLFEKLPQDDEHLFVASPLVHPKCFDYNPFSAYLLGTTQQAWLPLDEPRIELGHSSAHAAFIILQTLGCEQIYLVGQDLCYHQSSSHADSAWDMSSKLVQQRALRDKRQMELAGYDGKMHKSNAVWLQFLSTFVERLIPGFSGKVFHVTPIDEGVKIAGATRINPEQLSDHLREPLEDVVKSLRAKLKTRDLQASAARMGLFNNKLAAIAEFLKIFKQEADAFSLSVKRVQFSPEVSSEDWQQWKPVWEIFCERVQKYSDRYLNVEPEKFYYRNFLRPIVQGLLLRYQIDYFTKATEQQGDFGELNRKLEILFHMAKDEGYWANQALQLVQNYKL